MANRQEGGASTFGAIMGSLLLAAVCAAGGWMLRGLVPEKAAAAAGPAAKAPVSTVAVTNVEARAYNLPERFVAHAEPVQEVDLLPQVADVHEDGVVFVAERLVAPHAVVNILVREHLAGIAQEQLEKQGA